MTALGSLLSKDFSPRVRTRGQDLFRQGMVKILSASAWEVEAQLEGTDLYTIRLRLVNNEVHVCCTCPYYESTAPCKHLWATILQAQMAGFLQGDVALSGLVMIEDIPSEDDESEEEAVLFDLGVEPSHAFPLQRPGSKREKPKGPRPAPVPPPPAWRTQLEALKPLEDRQRPEDWPAGRRLLYLIDATPNYDPTVLTLEVTRQDKKANGDWSKPKLQRLRLKEVRRLPDPDDREILGMMAGGRNNYESSWIEIESSNRLFSPFAEMLLPRICSTGRCGLRLRGENDWTPITWDEGDPWQPGFRLRLEKTEWVFEGFLRRGDETMPLAEPLLISPGLVFTRDRAARLEGGEAFGWLNAVRSKSRLAAPQKDGQEFLAHLLDAPHLPPPEVPPELAYERVRVKPQPRIYIGPVKSYANQKLVGEVSFAYDGVAVLLDDGRQGLYDSTRRRLIQRDFESEQAALERLEDLRLRPYRSYWHDEPKGWEVPAKKLTAIAGALSAEGWLVEVEGKLFRQASNLRLDVSSGIDWFELHGEADFGPAKAALPELLKAVRRGETSVLLKDGSYGVVPEEWLARLQVFAGLGEAQDDHFRFRANQALLLDVLLAEQPQVSVDEVFDRARRRLREFEGVAAAEQPAGLKGNLRGYQREGLGWMRFLRDFGFGGCLADDMGVGKTVQVLALLEGLRASRDAATDAAGNKKAGAKGKAPGAKASANGDEARRPSLAVVPRSLIFNWIEEAFRFTPQLRLNDHTGADRGTADLADYDLVLTTYGTLQRDIAKLKDIEFDYVILDEAQTIKNAQTKSAKAARLLNARHRLALSGTPIENHLGELWSLFEFLNPGMLGSSWLGKKASRTLRNPDEATRRTLSRALRPFILRRTKEQVAAELPPKLEQTLVCEVQGAQRRLYNELRDHYRRSLLGKVDQQGLARSKMHVLEALLRLRQAACHPGLIDPQKADDSSAKLETLLPRLAEVLDEGHKALVFSQFTSLLAIVRRQLDADKTPYEYLDGKTRDRRACVERFQSDPECKLFLISLKAGGLGLNLTAAEYVFLLDPWWNPAVEAQAIDRAHRIGQERRVFAYRLIAKDTVEEKILELQQSKRGLADAIITADNSVIAKLTREDLELLLS